MNLTVITLPPATPTLIAASDRRRGYLAMVNTGGNDASFGFDSGITAGQGWPLYANGGGYTFSEQMAFTPIGQVYAVSTAGTTIVVMEG